MTRIFFMSIRIYQLCFQWLKKSCKKIIKGLKHINSLLPLQKQNNPFSTNQVNKNLSQKYHIKYIENKSAKNIGLLYRAVQFLYKNLILTLYYLYFHTYLNYTNLSWDSTNITNLEKPISQQKHAVKIIDNRAHFDHTKELFKSQNISNILL